MSFSTFDDIFADEDSFLANGNDDNDVANWQAIFGIQPSATSYVENSFAPENGASSAVDNYPYSSFMPSSFPTIESLEHEQAVSSELLDDVCSATAGDACNKKRTDEEDMSFYTCPQENDLLFSGECLSSTMKWIAKHTKNRHPSESDASIERRVNNLFYEWCRCKTPIEALRFFLKFERSDTVKEPQGNL